MADMIESMKNNLSLKYGQGPFTSCLETVLLKHHIARQAYHGKSFIGNHCNKYLQENVLKDLSDIIVETSDALVKDPDVHTTATRLSL